MTSHQHRAFPRLSASLLLQSAIAVCAASAVDAQAPAEAPFEQKLSGETGSWQFFPVQLPEGVQSFKVTLSGGNGDADLYVRPSEQPSLESFTCRPWTDGNDETCDTPAPQSGAWFIGIHAWTEFDGVVLKATWETPKETTPPQTGGLTPWQREMLDAHNLQRAKHCAAELTWDEELAKAAQAWADQCVWKHGSTGENLAAAAGQLKTPTQTTDGWYSEIAQYDFSSPGYSDATGHFTQVVWKGSTRLGCAQATCPATNISPSWTRWDTAQLVVCRYLEAGNLPSAFPENVLPVADGGVCD